MLDLALLAVGLAVYGAVFAFVGAWLKRPLVIGLVFAFGWEQLALALPGYLRQFTVAHYLQALVPHTMPADGALSAIQGLFRQTTSATAALGALGRDACRVLVVGHAHRLPAGVRAGTVTRPGLPPGGRDERLNLISARPV